MFLDKLYSRPTSYKDIFSYEFDGCWRVCPVNKAGMMGTGLSLEFKKRVSGLYSCFYCLCQRGFLMGADTYVVDDTKVILFTTNVDYFEKPKFEYVAMSLEKLRFLCNDVQGEIQKEDFICFPKFIFGKLDPLKAKSMVIDFSKKVPQDIIWLGD